jgi:multicomponent Na+:H+ antiporter subunit D
METPTPVSAYLHSATTVTAGVYLLAHLNPALGGTELWFYIVGGVGALHFLLMGVCGTFLIDDLFNLYLWFKVVQVASFVLLALGGERRQMEGGITYVMPTLSPTAMFLTALGLLYGFAGTLAMADLAQQFAAREGEASRGVRLDARVHPNFYP